MLHLLAPGAAGSLKQQFQPDRVTATNSTQHRENDYTAVLPDILSHPALGRGFGSYDSLKYRVIDNEYLSLLIAVGAIGTAAYLLMMFLGGAAAHRVARRRGDPLGSHGAGRGRGDRVLRGGQRARSTCWPSPTSLTSSSSSSDSWPCSAGLGRRRASPEDAADHPSAQLAAGEAPEVRVRDPGGPQHRGADPAVEERCTGSPKGRLRAIFSERSATQTNPKCAT